VIITYEMSRKIANTSWVQLAFSFALAFGIYIFHQTLREVILVQLVLMVILLAVLIVPLLLQQLSPHNLGTYTSLRVTRDVTEEEVIACFLSSEFHHPEFEEYRTEFDYLVQQPDLKSARENALRRALLFLRRGAMWRELPADTQWFEVELTSEDLSRIRFFPRAQWRRVAKGNFYLTDVVDRLRVMVAEASEDPFLLHLRRLSTPGPQQSVNPSVLLIGVNEQGPLTILDGNHRIAAAMLAPSPTAALGRLQFICGFSPYMVRCCWYQTNVNTLFRYFTNLVRNVTYDAESDIGRLQEGDL
jgi:hypothetical protein